MNVTRAARSIFLILPAAACRSSALAFHWGLFPFPVASYECRMKLTSSAPVQQAPAKPEHMINGSAVRYGARAFREGIFRWLTWLDISGPKLCIGTASVLHKEPHRRMAGPRNITAHSSLSAFAFVLPGASGKREPPLLSYGETGIEWYFTLVDGVLHRFPSIEGNFDPPVPYIQSDHVTKLKFRLSAAALGLGGSSVGVRALHVINYFE